MNMDTQDKNGYFHRLHAQTPTRFWVNNPSRDEADWAITAGAVGCTCNPSFGQKMLDHPSEEERRYASALLDEAIASTDNDSEAHVVYQRTLVKPIMEKFLPLHQSNPRRYGFVSISHVSLITSGIVSTSFFDSPRRRLRNPSAITAPIR